MVGCFDRGTTDQIADVQGILKEIYESKEIQTMRNKYRKQFAWENDNAQS